MFLMDFKLLTVAALIPLIAGCANGLRDLQSDQKTVRGKYTEARYVIRGRPHLLKSNYSPGEFILDVPPRIVNSELEYGILTWPTGAADPLLIDSNKIYKFEILLADRIPENENGHKWTDLTLLRIWDRGHLLFDASLCEIHHEKMLRRMEVTTSVEEYNMPQLKRDKKMGFPNDGIGYEGCGVGISHLKWACRSCEENAARWRKQQNIQEIPEEKGF